MPPLIMKLAVPVGRSSKLATNGSFSLFPTLWVKQLGWQKTSAKSLVIPQAGERGAVSLREFHVKGAAAE